MKADSMNDQLRRRVAEFNDDYFDERGKRPRNFVCPVTLLDEPTELIKGHVFSQSLPGCRRTWVPQRKDIDNVFSTVEADFHAAINARSVSIDEIMADKKLYKQIRPTFEFNGARVKGGFHRMGRKKDNQVDFVAQLPIAEVGEKSSVTIDSIIERDDCAAAFICALQSAHLTMFELLGYSYVFSYSGQFLAGILNEYAQRTANDKASKIRVAESFHSTCMQMVVPLEATSEKLPFQGTLDDQKLLTVIDSIGRQYATGIVTRFASEFLIVLLPSGKDVCEKYMQSLLHPIDSIKFQIARIETHNRRIARVIPAPQTMTIQKW
jgi:hypothetical protein